MASSAHCTFVLAALLLCSREPELYTHSDRQKYGFILTRIGFVQYAGRLRSIGRVVHHRYGMGVGDDPAPPAEAYMSSEVLIGNEAAFNELLQDILWTPAFVHMQPLRIVEFRFPRQELRKIRVVQIARVPDQQWSVTELRVLDGANELPRSSEWRLTAHPNPWDVQLAFDSSPVTRWRSWHRRAGHVQDIVWVTEGRKIRAQWL